MTLNQNTPGPERNAERAALHGQEAAIENISHDRRKAEITSSMRRIDLLVQPNLLGQYAAYQARMQAMNRLHQARQREIAHQFQRISPLIDSTEAMIEWHMLDRIGLRNELQTGLTKLRTIASSPKPEQLNYIAIWSTALTLQEQVTRFRSLGAATPEVERALRQVEEVLTLYTSAIGAPPGALRQAGVIQNRIRSSQDKRLSEVVRLGGGAVFGLGFLLTGTVALLSKNGTQNWKPALLYGGVAAGFLLGPDLLKKQSDVLYGEIKFLGMQEYEKLRQKYGIGIAGNGREWAEVFDVLWRAQQPAGLKTYMEKVKKNEEVTDEERIHAANDLCPKGSPIRSHVERLLAQPLDFSTFTGLIRTARSKRGRDYVKEYLGADAGPEAWAVFGGK